MLIAGVSLYCKGKPLWAFLQAPYSLFIIQPRKSRLGKLQYIELLKLDKASPSQLTSYLSQSQSTDLEKEAFQLHE